MASDYSPVKTSNKSKSNAASFNSVRSVKKVDDLYPDPETWEKLTNIASQGYSMRSIAYMMGVSPEKLTEFQNAYPDRFADAIEMGRVIDETEILSRLRGAAVSPKSANWLTALQVYGKIKFGWLGQGGNSSSRDLPSSLAFTMIEPPTTDESDG